MGVGCRSCRNYLWHRNVHPGELYLCDWYSYSRHRSWIFALARLVGHIKNIHKVQMAVVSLVEFCSVYCPGSGNPQMDNHTDGEIALVSLPWLLEMNW